MPLPASNLADVQLAALFDGPGCPACRARDRATARFLDAWLYEGVNDVQRRRELDEARGLCRPHVHALLAADRGRGGGQLGTSILLDAILKVRLRELRAAHGTRGRGRGKRVEDATRPARCPVCREVATAEGAAIGGILAHLGDAQWAAAAMAATFCLLHLLRLMADGSSVAGWAAVEARQIARIDDLQRRVAAFAHHSSHDRRHLLTPDQVGSVDELAAFLGDGD